MNAVFVDCLVNSVFNQLSVAGVTKVVKHVNTGLEHGDGVSNVLSGDGGAGVASARLEHSILKK